MTDDTSDFEPGGTADSLSPSPDGDGTGTAPRHHRRRPPIWMMVLVLLAVAVVVASRVSLNEFALLPGTAQSVQQYISVPGDKGHPVKQPILLTDVNVANVNALNYLFFALQSHVSFQSVAATTGGAPASEFGAQGQVDMRQAEQAAETAALRRLGYHVTTTNAGAVVYSVFSGTAAWGVLNVGDVITAIDGSSVTDAQSASTLLHKLPSDATVRITILPGGTGPSRTVTVKLRPTRVLLGTDSHGKPVYDTLDLGIDPEDYVTHVLPFPVTIDVQDIGGPSAGLAMTLGLIDTLTGGDLTGGVKVAVTGTIDDKGDVGDVGGVAQKTVAVADAGAKVFIVPPQELGVAEAQHMSGLQVYAASTLDQALSIIAAHGGHVPPPVAGA